jgi:uncharacterized protein (DUF58 family)
MSLIDPGLLERLDSYALLARRVVEGYMSGLHRSLQQGSGTEFVQYRNYAPGDDLKYLDWKVYGRTGKLCTKVFEEETDMSCRIVLDCSASMSYQGRKSAVPKMRYALALAASLAYLVNRQGDQVGFYAYNDRVRSLIGSGKGQSHLQTIFGEMNRLQAEGQAQQRRCLNKIAGTFKGRGLLVLISDVLDGEEDIMQFLRSARFSNNDCLLLQVLDEDELEFSFGGSTRFVDLESAEELITAAPAAAEKYRGEMQRHLEKIRAACLKNQVDYQLLSSAESLEASLALYLHKRHGAG